jgi:hypothetical protein
MSNAEIGVISLQKGQMTITASHSSEHVHRFDIFAMHPQHTDWPQHERFVALCAHEFDTQYSCAQIVHMSLCPNRFLMGTIISTTVAFPLVRMLYLSRYIIQFYP